MKQLKQYFLLLLISGITAALALETGIELSDEPSDVVGVKGQSAQLNCSAVSIYGNATIAWLKDGVKVDTSTRRYEFHADGSLGLLNLAKKHEGVYQCVVRNSAGVVVTRSASVKVMCKCKLCQIIH